MPCSGSGSEDCTGCYALRGGSPVRVGDLNLSTGTCEGIGSSSEQKIRVFVGYERKCPTGTPVGDTCTGDGQLFLSCSMTSEDTSGGDAGFIFNKECFAGTPYVRRAKMAAATVTVIPSAIPTWSPVCAAGTMGIYPSCLPCSDTSYKATSGNGGCTECVPPNISNSLTSSISTAGTTKTSASDCVVSFTCNNPYVQNLGQNRCDPPILQSSPTPSPTPSLLPAPSPTPAALSCADANFYLTSQQVEPAYPPNYNIHVTLQLNPVFGSSDFCADL